jgi:hypothetical protein
MGWRRGREEALVGACGPGCGSGAGAGKRAGDAPGPQAGLWKRLPVAGVRRSGGISAEQRLDVAEQDEREGFQAGGGRGVAR